MTAHPHNSDFAALAADNLAAGYRKGNKTQVILHGLSFSLPAGQLVSLLGENGIGKSTLLRTVSGIQPPLEGEVTAEGKPLSRLTVAERAKLIAIVTTERTNAGALTVEEVVALGRQPHTGFLGRLSDTDRNAVSHALRAVGISHKSKCFMAELSDGERQKTMIAKAIAQETPVILLDEPTAFLDLPSRTDIIRLLHHIARTEGKVVLQSSHDLRLSIGMSDKLWLLLPDRTLCQGTPEDLALNGTLDKLFNDRGLRFDLDSGEFIPTETDYKQITIDGATPQLIQWCEHALLRNGYAPSSQPSPQTPFVHIDTPNNITLATPEGATFRLSSIEAMLNTLNSADHIQ